MAHIQLPENLPGITGPMVAYPATARALNGIAEAVLVKDTKNLSKAARETIANYVSYLNGCVFCSESHAAVADLLWDRPGLSRELWKDVDAAPVSDVLKALLAIAAKVQKDARTVATADVDKAKALGASDEEIHDTVLIAAAFCMFNRYVDGLGTPQPPRQDPAYLEVGVRLATKGYVKSIGGG